MSDNEKPASGDAAVAGAITALVSALTVALMGQRDSLDAFLTMLESMNDGMIGDGAFRTKLQAGVHAQRAILAQMPR